MKIDLESLEKALASLGRAIERSSAAGEDEELRDAVIQRFEYSLDLSWKFIRRFALAAGVSDSEIRTKRDIFRIAARMGWIDDPESWFTFHEARNETSHTYDAIVAKRVHSTALDFYPAAVMLLGRLSKTDA